MSLEEHDIGGITDFVRTHLDTQNSIKRVVEVAPGHLTATWFDGSLIDVRIAAVSSQEAPKA